ncbi:islet amyloid polypeptide [Rousettus aegyptiacus]|uniref:islet amyloid polypeptide n=1 Tax=Rousettus aegyptiacus TaxID=9407 RepID=UPI00168D7D59|nr:islet amyloid polypeptide [Rousettus aegyptiacus]
MCPLQLLVVLTVPSVALSHLKATPIERLITLNILSLFTLKQNVVRKYRVDINKFCGKKSKCNTATCAVQWLANFLVHSSNNFSVSLSLTNVGSNTYGKRNTVEILNKNSLTDLSL